MYLDFSCDNEFRHQSTSKRKSAYLTFIRVDSINKSAESQVLRDRKMIKRYMSKNRRKFNLKVHLIFVTKYRRPILVAGLETCVKEKISDLCLKHEWEIVAMETDRDHIHLLLSYDTTERVSDIVHCLKQETTWELWQKFYCFLRQRYWKKHIFWSDGYFACSVGKISTETARHYIENQG